MTYQSKSVLRQLRKLVSNTEDLLYFDGEDNFIYLDEDSDKKYDCSRYKGEIGAIIDQLLDEKYLKPGLNKYYFSFTELGLHPYQNSWNKFKSFLFQSVLVPIAVSVATSLITLWLQGLL
ncbi:MAG: hypothetical protein ACOCM4_09590 [Acetivibrio ethanolgignens]